MTRLIAMLLIGLFFAPTTAAAEDPPAEREPPMTMERLGLIVFTLDPEAQAAGNVYQMTIDKVTVIVIADPAADRMRAIAPIRDAGGIAPEDLHRMMQANFDSALDGRYAIAQGTLWAAFIHPLSPLEKNEFISGLGQVVNLAKSYGTLYSGGALTFSGGDSGALQRSLIDELLELGEDI